MKEQEAEREARRAALDALFVLAAAARRLSLQWHTVLDREYPRYLPSFDEFAADLDRWQAHVLARVNEKL